MTYQLGIDLGTTFTSAAAARDERAEAVSLGDHAFEVPSVVYLGPDGRYLAGDAAAAREAEEPERVAREFKRRIGDATSINLGGVPVSAQVLMAKLVESVVELVTQRQGGPPQHVSVACPANWGAHRRETLQHALAIADLDGAHLVTEPEAAALHFGAADRLGDGETLAVYDLGGGTFDAALLRRRGSSLELLGRAEGLEHLGGLDVDAALVAHAWGRLGLEADVDDSDPVVRRGLLQLREECVRAKERLSHDVSASIPVSLPGAPPWVRLTRSELEELISPLVDETVTCLERTLRHASITADDLTGVLLVGGSSRIPLVSERLTERLGRPLHQSPQPTLCVAMGAALFAGGRALGPPVGRPAPVMPSRQRTLPEQPAPVTPAARGPQPEPDIGTENPAPAPPPPPTRDRSGVPSRAANGGSRTARVYRFLAAVTVAVGLLVAFLAPAQPEAAVSWTRGESSVTVPGRGALLAISAAGVGLPRTPVGRSTSGGGPFRLSSSQTLFLTGPAQVTRLDGSGAPIDDARWLVPTGGSWWSPIATIPGALMVLALLFSLAYAESLARAARRHRSRVVASEVAGLAGSGAVLGVAVSVLAWATGRAPEPGVVVVTTVCLAAGLGLLPFTIGPRGSGPATGSR